MIRKALLAVALVAALCVFAPAATSQAQTPPFGYGSTCMITLSGPVSGLVTVNGTGFPPNFQTDITVNGTPATPSSQATTDPAGSFTTQINVPPGGAVQATCGDPNSFATAILGTQVVAATSTTVAATTSAPLPRTGSDSTDLVPFAIGAVAIGAGLVLATRRRRAA